MTNETREDEPTPKGGGDGSGKGITEVPRGGGDGSGKAISADQSSNVPQSKEKQQSAKS